MNIEIYKGVFHIGANLKSKDLRGEKDLVNKATVLMENLINTKCFNGCDDDYEYYNTVDSNYHTIKEIRDYFRSVKKELLN